ACARQFPSPSETIRHPTLLRAPSRAKYHAAFQAIASPSSEFCAVTEDFRAADTTRTRGWPPQVQLRLRPRSLLSSQSAESSYPRAWRAIAEHESRAQRAQNLRDRFC